PPYRLKQSAPLPSGSPRLPSAKPSGYAPEPSVSPCSCPENLPIRKMQDILSKPLLVLLLLPAALAYAGTDATASSFLKQQQDSLAQQRASLHQQLASRAIGPAGKAADPTAEPAAYFIDPLPPLPQADCERLDKTTVESLISAAAKKQSLDPALLRAVMKQESGFKPCAVS